MSNTLQANPDGKRISSDDASPNRWTSAGSTIAISALLGFAIGTLVYPCWTANVESAQIQSGIVAMPPGSPMYLLHSQLYSLLIQSASVLLRGGLSERTVSVLFSGLQAALVFASLSAWVLCFTQRAIVALVVPVVLLAWADDGQTGSSYVGSFAGHQYPVSFPDAGSLYGVVGLNLTLLTLALAGLGLPHASAFLVGIAPAVHPTWALAAWAGAACFLTMSNRGSLDHARMVRYFACGFSITLCSAAWHLASAGLPAILTGASDAAHAQLFLAHWDDHRIAPSARTLLLLEPEIYQAGLTATILVFARREFPPRVRVMLLSLLCITGLALAGLLIGPSVAMPFRWLNLNSVALPATTVGVLAYLGFNREHRLPLHLLVLGCALIGIGYISTATVYAQIAARDGAITIPLLLRGSSLPLLIVAAAACLARSSRTRVHSQSSRARLATLALGVIGLAMLIQASSTIRVERIRGRDANTALLMRLRATDGLLVVSPDLWRVGYAQLRARHGLLLDPMQLDLVAYAPAAIPAIERVLSSVYGVSQKDERDDQSLEGVPKTWAQRPTEEWQTIGREFGVTQVLTARDWPLQLPQVAAAGDLTLFRIP